MEKIKYNNYVTILTEPHSYNDFFTAHELDTKKDIEEFLSEIKNENKWENAIIINCIKLK